MRIRRELIEPITREEAVNSGFRYYGDVSEVHIELPEGEMGELLGTRIAMISVETGHAILSTTVEVAGRRTQRAYERDVRKSIDRDARSINSYNQALAKPSSS